AVIGKLLPLGNEPVLLRSCQLPFSTERNVGKMLSMSTDTSAVGNVNAPVCASASRVTPASASAVIAAVTSAGLPNNVRLRANHSAASTGTHCDAISTSASQSSGCPRSPSDLSGGGTSNSIPACRNNDAPAGDCAMRRQ